VSNKQIKVIDDYVNYLTVDNDVRSNKQIKEQIKALFNAINEDIKSGIDVRINKFGTFKLSTRSARPERKGCNPRTGEELVIAAQPEKHVISFKASKVK
jgi:nucleoid DNA-binding protein